MGKAESRRPARLVPFAWFVFALAFALVSIAQAAPGGEWTVEYRTGYDNEVLADPERDGILTPVAASFISSASRLRLWWPGESEQSAWLAMSGEMSWAGYAGDGPGADLHGFGEGRFRRVWSSLLLTDLSASYLSFRRRDFELFDLDRPQVGANVIGRIGARNLVGLHGAHSWPSYPGRWADDSTATQSDRQLDLSLSWTRELGRHASIGAEAGYRRLTSNVASLEYDSPWITIRSAAGRLETLRAWAYLSFAQRSYPEYPVLVSVGDSLYDTGLDRTDETWRIGAGVERAVSSRFVLLGQVMALHQTSKIDEMEFDQVRVWLGARYQLWKRADISPPRSGLMSGEIGFSAPRTSSLGPPLTPEVVAGGVRFVCRAPGAHEVAVVGGFNGWNAQRGALTDQDGNGIWEAILQVPAGTWRYAMVVDGEWMRPDGAPRYEADGFGGWTGILEIAPAKRPAGESGTVPVDEGSRRP